MVTKFKKQLEPLIAVVARPFLSWNPAMLTLLSLLAAVVFFVGIVTHMYLMSIISSFGFAFDMMDGYVARKQKKSSKKGSFLDSSLDRVSDFFIFSGFGFAHLVRWELVLIVVFISFFISYLRTLAELTFGTTPVTTKGFMQRTERICFIVLALLLFLLFPGVTLYHFSILTIAFILLVVLNCLTCFQRFLLILTHD